LCVGCDTVDELIDWRRQTSIAGQPWILRTRQTPKRADELIEGGALYRVYKGFILSRQRILAVGTVGEGPSRRCEIRLEETVVLTVPTPRRPFQGWRYLPDADAPADLGESDGQASLPPELAMQLRLLGAW
jgi:hypothetical protein